MAVNRDKTNPYVRKQWGTEYLLDVLSYSYDPDNKEDKVLYDRNDSSTVDGKPNFICCR